jgi:heat shock protein HspQ
MRHRLQSRFRFQVGDVVHHRRYDYRGVVLAADALCQAPDDWYLRNQTQPDRNQPWYRVLVDGGRETYVAQENLEPDDVGEAVDHPLVPLFFPTFHAGRYHRASLN